MADLLIQEKAFSDSDSFCCNFRMSSSKFICKVSSCKGREMFLQG